MASPKMTKCLYVLKKPGQDGGGRIRKAGLCLERCVSLIVHNFLRIHYSHSQEEYYFHDIILKMALFLFLFKYKKQTQIMSP